MEKIKKIWFDEDFIYMESSAKHRYSRPLADFPLLKKASRKQRENYRIVRNGEALRWAEIDEDIHISSFYEKGNEPNEIATIFYNFPMLTVSGVAEHLGINKTLLYNYIYGIKKPSAKRLAEIKASLRSIGKLLASI